MYMHLMSGKLGLEEACATVDLWPRERLVRGALEVGSRKSQVVSRKCDGGSPAT